MWDDSYDSSSPDVKRKGGGLNSRKSSQKDIDALFSSASESGSPVARTEKRTYSTYDLLEPKKQDDLLGHLVASGDFEDSILGELLGGGGKKPNLVDPPKPLEPPQSDKPPTVSAPRPGGRSPPSTGRNAFRFATEGSPTSSAGAPSPMRSSDAAPSLPPFGAGRPHTNSIDIDYVGTGSPAGLGRMTESGGSVRPPSQPTGRNRSSGTLFSSTESLPPAVTAPVSSLTFPAPTFSAPTATDKGDDDVDMGGFVPSAMEGRRGRRGRNSDSRPSTGGNLGGFDALDAALGIGVPSGPSSVGGSSQPLNTTPALTTRKSFSDPFAKVEARIPIVAGRKIGVISDSDSDDGAIRPLNSRKSFLVNKPSVKFSEEKEPASATRTSDSDPAARDDPVVVLRSSLAGLPSFNNSAEVPPPPPGRQLSTDDEQDISEISDIRARKEPFSASSVGPSRESLLSTVGQQAHESLATPSGGKSPTFLVNSITVPVPGPATVVPASMVVTEPASVPSSGSGVRLSIKSVGQTRTPPKPVQASTVTAAATTIPTFTSSIFRDEHNEEGSRPSTSTISASGLSAHSDNRVPERSSQPAAASTLPRQSVAVPPPVEQAGPLSFSGSGASRERGALNEPSTEQLVHETRRQADAHQHALAADLQTLQAQLMTHSVSQAYTPPSATVHVSKDEFLELRSMQEQNYRYVQDLMASKQVIVSLEHEIARLKDEALISKLRHSEQIKELEHRRDETLAEQRLKAESERGGLEVRHKEALLAMERLHAEELSIYKEKLNNADMIEKISKQIYQTSDSMKHLEQELSTRHRHIELVKEGQQEMRERVVEEMERKLQASSEQHEAEVYKLQGIIVHMEQMMGNLKAQHYEEKERLHQEHRRLESLQDAVTAERGAFVNRMAEENAYQKQKLADLEHARSGWLEEKKMEMENLHLLQRRLDNDKRDFDSLVVTQKRALEAKELLLREEEARISRLRDELHQEQGSFEQRRAVTTFELEAAERTITNVQQQQDALNREKDNLSLQVYQQRMDQDELERLRGGLQEQMQALQERENALREGFAEMRLAAHALQERERALTSQHAIFDSKTQEMAKMEIAMEERRIAQARSFREYLQNVPNNTPAPSLPQADMHAPPLYKPPLLLPAQVPHGHSTGMSSEPLAYSASMSSASSLAPEVRSNAHSLSGASVALANRGLPHEVKMAQRALREHRQALSQLSMGRPRASEYLSSSSSTFSSF